jgi:nucleotide sugar dehydrogenase
LEEGSGLTEGVDFHLVFSPERVLTGRVFEDLRKYPKLLGGLSQEGAKRAVDFYERVLEFDERPDLERGNGVWDLGSAEAAEMAKLAETTYRDVNIGLANQFGAFAAKNGIDVYQVIEASNSQPYSHIHRPGIAVGGHCIPVYPRLYLWNDPDATVVRAAREANAAMPGYTVGLAVGAAGGSLDGKKVAVLGASYRGGVKETAFSGVFATVDALRDAGADVVVHDPMYSPDELGLFGWDAYAVGTPVDMVVVQADHAEYRDLSAADFPGVQVVVDGRRVLDPARFDGVRYLVVGAAEQEA